MRQNAGVTADDSQQKQAAPRRAPGRPRTIDREAIVDAATACYWQEGPAGLSLNEVCRRVGVAKPGVYREFGGEDGLLAAAIDRYRAHVVVPLLDLLNSDRQFMDALDDVLAMITMDDGPAGCLLVEMRLAPGRLGPVSRERLDAVRAEMLSSYAERYARAAAREETDAAIDPAFAASYIDAQLTSALMRVRRGDDPATVTRQAHLALQALQPG